MPVQPKCAGTSQQNIQQDSCKAQDVPCTCTVHATRCIQMIKRWVKCWFNEAKGNSFIVIISSLCKVLPWTRATIAAWTFEVGCDGADSVWPLNAKHWHYRFHSRVRSRTSIYIIFLTCRNQRPVFFFGKKNHEDDSDLFCQKNKSKNELCNQIAPLFFTVFSLCCFASHSESFAFATFCVVIAPSRGTESEWSIWQEGRDRSAFFWGYEAYNIFICIYIYIYIGLVSSKQGGGFKCF